MPIYKKWFKDFNEKRDNMEKEMLSKGVVGKESDLPAKSKLGILISRLTLFSKENNSLKFNFYINGEENNIGFYFVIPYLINFSFELGLEREYFKKKFPLISKKSRDTNWGFGFYPTYAHFKFNSYNNIYGKSFGFSKFIEYVDLLKGDVKEITEGKLEKALETNISISTNYKLSGYPKEVKLIYSNSEMKGTARIDIPLTIYKKTITYHYKRWFSKTITRYEVESHVGIIVPGKGESSWDQDDWIMESKLNTDGQSTGFSCVADSTEEAAIKYRDSILRNLKR